MNFFVTGATGFIGKWLVRDLISNGHVVSVLSRSGESKGLPADAKVFKGDVTDLESLVRAFKEQHGVFHLAGYIGYMASERKLMENVNVLGTKNVAEACLKTSVGRLVHMSSVNAIGASFGPEVLNENSDYNLAKYNLGYSETKRRAEEIIRAKADRLNAVILCPSTVYGAGDATKGSRSVQIKVARGKFPFYTGGGVSVANVEDVVRATRIAFEKGRTGERYILAGENLTIKAVFNLIAAEAGVAPPRFKLPKKVINTLAIAGEWIEKIGLKGPINSESAVLSQMYHWFDSSKAIKELDYKITSAKKSIGDSVQWMKDQGILNAHN